MIHPRSRGKARDREVLGHWFAAQTHCGPETWDARSEPLAKRPGIDAWQRVGKPAIVKTLAPDSRCANARRTMDLERAERIRRQISMDTPAGSGGMAVQSHRQASSPCLLVISPTLQP